MKAILYERFGGPEVLRMANVATPELRKGELLVRIRAAAMNPVDWKIRTGAMKFVSGRKFPRRSGIDFSGVVEACGSAVVGLRPGDPVLGLSEPMNASQGSFAEKCVTRADHVLRKPERLRDIEAAAAPVAGLSALQSLRHCRVGAGKRVLLIGASGGVGTFAIQIAKVLGAHVTAVCGPHGVELCYKLGADLVIDRTREDPLKSRLLYDAILDLAPAHSFSSCRHLLSSDGAYLSTLPSIDGIWGRAWTSLFSARRVRMLILKPSAGDLKELGTMLAAGSVTPSVCRVFPFTEEGVQEMNRVAEAGHTLGKLAMEMPGT
ncbi:MAG TPA: NAD(P)-dependent alcohol dehydrogenase [Opitutaceae bacterium]|nr:NAD(P)-dependent alcohol dehydrogenase [Opitutaceae bacterium]